MQEQGIDLDSFQQEQRLSSKILEKVIGGTDQSDDPRNCHDRSVGSGPNHDRSHDKVHSKSILHSRCDHPKK